MDSIFVFQNPVPDNAAGPRVIIQPNISVAGWPAEAGSKALTGFKALEDATIIKRLRQAGFSLYGSTRMSEFGFGLSGSNAGEAVRRHYAAGELVLDFLGESRLAALRAGILGFKPSYGLLSRLGLIGLIPSMECCSILAAGLATVREIMKAVSGPDDLDYSLPDAAAPGFTSLQIDPAQTTIGTISEAQSDLSAVAKQQFQSSLQELLQAGFNLKELSLPDFSLFSLVHKIAGSVEASSCAGRYDSVRYGQRAPGAKNWNEMYLLSRGAAFGPLLKSYLFQGAYFQFENYAAFENACRIRARLLEAMQHLCTQVDYLVFPLCDCLSPGDADSISGLYTQFAMTVFANVTGQPVLSLPPAAAGEAGLQFSGPRLSDARLLALGDYLLKIRQGGR